MGEDSHSCFSLKDKTFLTLSESSFGGLQYNFRAQLTQTTKFLLKRFSKQREGVAMNCNSKYMRNNLPLVKDKHVSYNFNLSNTCV